MKIPSNHPKYGAVGLVLTFRLILIHANFYDKVDAREVCIGRCRGRGLTFAVELYQGKNINEY